jgi:uncharacterized RDD family membrane protein YckC
VSYYYAKGGDKIGPLTGEEFGLALDRGDVGPSTLVWTSGMDNWKPFADAASLFPARSPSAPSVPAASPVSAYPAQAENPVSQPGKQACAECGGLFDPDDMVRHGASWICAGCKPLFLQKLREGVGLRSAMNYAGFWIRVAAYLLDWVINLVLTVVVTFVPGLLFIGDDSGIGGLIGTVLGAIIGPAYYVFFVGKYAATPGKMAIGLKIVRSDGSRVSYPRAFARIFALSLAAIPLGAGLIAVGFDPEKRGWHDRICDTRVIRK